jgi:uncharacterized phage infection (PIP) family protein YhgE
MQARANAIGELTAAGTLPDLLAPSGDDLQNQLDQLSAGSSVDSELAALKAQLGQGAPPPPQLGPHTETGQTVIRVQGSGQYRLAQSVMDQLHQLDHQLAEAVAAHNEQRVHELLNQMTSLVQTRGTAVGTEELVPSEITLPRATLTVEEVQALLQDDNSALERAEPGT